MLTCFIRYIVDLNKINEFEDYACAWIALVEKYGGIHHGYFLPGKNSDNLPGSAFSFPDIGTSGPNNVAVALFSFPSLEKYETYKKEVAKDKACQEITARANSTKCFLNYERHFLKPIFKDEAHNRMKNHEGRKFPPP